MFTYLLQTGDLDVANHIARLDAAETTTVKAAVSALIIGLKIDNLWNKIDVLCVAHNVESDSLLNLKGNSTGAPDSIKVNSPVFTASRGFLTNASSGDRMSFNASEVSLSLYSLYDAHFFQYMRTFNHTGFSRNSLGFYSAADGASVIAPREDISPDRIFFATQSIAGASVVQNTPIGFAGTSAVSTTDRPYRLNDTSGSDIFPYSSYTLSTELGLIGAAPPLFAAVTGEQFAAWGAGGGLTQVELGLYEDRIRTYMQAIGADVY